MKGALWMGCGFSTLHMAPEMRVGQTVMAPYLQARGPQVIFDSEETTT
jgi:hypothetical protein